MKVLKGLSKPLMPNITSQSHNVLQRMLVQLVGIPSPDRNRKTARSYMVGPNNLDSSNILVGAWVYLDESSADDNDMRTIFTNKKSGCENQRDQFGLSM